MTFACSQLKKSVPVCLADGQNGPCQCGTDSHIDGEDVREGVRQREQSTDGSDTAKWFACLKSEVQC